MDSTSANFDSRANAAGSCVGSKELGCMNPAAVNFDSRATLHDASCIYKRRGCLNSTASNYDPLAEVDAPCVHGVQVCTARLPRLDEPGVSLLCESGGRQPVRDAPDARLYGPRGDHIRLGCDGARDPRLQVPSSGMHVSRRAEF
jgi:hypothetical protein